MDEVIVTLPVELVARCRAVDRELVGSAIVDTPSHLDALTADIGDHGVRVPLSLGFDEDHAFLDGNHRIAAALRLGLAEVPVALRRSAPACRPGHAVPIGADDHAILEAAWAAAG